MFRNRTVTVVIPAYNEAETIGAVVADFQTEPHVDEVVVVDNNDVIKLLVYLDDAGMVMGTRTTRQLVQQGANMRSFLRWGNVFMAKFLQLCWLRPSEPRFTDVGCTYRALTRDTYLRIRGLLREPGPAFSPEMMCAALQARCRVIEVPVTYSKRLGGDSKHSDTFMRQARTALMMFRTICRKRFLEWRLSGATLPSRDTATRADRQAAGDAEI